MWKGKLQMVPIGHFRVTFCLKPKWKRGLICGTLFHLNGFARRPMHSLTFRRGLLRLIDFRQFSGSSYWVSEYHCWRRPRGGHWWSRMEAVCYLRGLGRNGASNFDHQSVTSSKSATTKQSQSVTHWERKIPLRLSDGQESTLTYM